MSNLQVSERIIKEKFELLSDKNNTKLNSNESTLYYHDNLVYKIFKPSIRISREKNLYLLNNKSFSYANNIIDKLYQGDKLIGITNKYLENFETIKKYMPKLDLYQIKEIINYLITFYEETLENNLVYWDNHLDNFGISNNKFYVLDIDSMAKKENDLDVYYALNGLLSIFYELYYKNEIRNKYMDYRNIIYLLSECDNYIYYKLSLNEIKKIIKNTTEDYLESKRYILEQKRFSCIY